MNIKMMTAALATLSSSSYTTPTVNVIEVRTEGLLCASAPGTSVEEWKEEDLGW